MARVNTQRKRPSGQRVRLVASQGTAPAQMYVVATDDEGRAVELAAEMYGMKVGYEFETWPYTGQELDDMVDDEVRPING